MATNIDFVEYVCGQIKGFSAVRYRKMFGDYMIYVNDKPVLLLCDNNVFVKELPEVEAIISDLETGVPYDGAIKHYVIDPDDERFNEVVEALEEIIPGPKKKGSAK